MLTINTFGFYYLPMDLEAYLRSGCTHQVNAKIGGINMDCPELYEHLVKVPTLILQGDVSHGGPGSRQPSVCALVGNVNKHMSQLSASLSISPQQEEDQGEGVRRMVRTDVMNQMKRMVMERMEAFYR